MRVVTVSVVLLGLCWLAAPTAQGGRKVYISVDMEGISGVNGNDQTEAGQPEYQRARKLMVEDANAAIRGAFAGGATEVVVNDSHGSQRNLLPEDLDPRVRLITHSFKRHGMMEGLDETFDSVLFIGYHAKAGADRGVFAHTGSSVVRDLQLNGVSVGEGGLNAAMARWYGVTVALVTGDDAAVAEVKASAPAVTTVAVKRAINTRALEMLPLAEARRLIEAGAKDAVAAAKKPAPDRTGPYRVTMRFRDVTIPEVMSAFREMERPSPDSLSFQRDAMPEAYRLIRVLYRFVNTN